MHATTETITPQLAAAYLQASKVNRPVSRHNLDRICLAIKTGEWVANGDAIRFDTSGRLLDGHHRLMAVAKTGMSINTLVVRNIIPRAFLTIDTGKLRNAADVFGILGEVNTTRLSAMVRFVIQYESGQIKSGQISNEVMVAALTRHPGLRGWTHYTKSLSKITNFGSYIAAVGYLAALSRPEEARQFIDDLCSGAGLLKGSPALTLRERLVQSKSARAKDPASYIMQIVIHAYNAFAKGETRSILKADATSNALPAILGVSLCMVAA